MNEDLPRMLKRMSERVCRLVLNGGMTLSAAVRQPASAECSEEYVEAILSEVRRMPDDLRDRFVAGELTVRQVRAELLRRLVSQGRITERDAATFSAYSVDLDTIHSYAV